MKNFIWTLWKYLATGGGRRNQANTFTGLSFTSSLTSYVAAGRHGKLYMEDGWVLKPTVSHGGRVVSFMARKLTSTESWSVEFRAAGGHKLASGDYRGAVRHSPDTVGAPTPGLNFSGCGRENDDLTGQFDVLEIFMLGGKVLSFAADFIQKDGGREGNWNRGSVRYNSQIRFITDEKQR